MLVSNALPDIRFLKKHSVESALTTLRNSKDKDMMNKAIFEENWKAIRGQINAKWNLMVEYDLVKVDKAEVKFDKFATMLQVKYGYTRQQAKEEIVKLWANYESNHKSKV